MSVFVKEVDLQSLEVGFFPFNTVSTLDGARKLRRLQEVNNSVNIVTHFS